MQSDHLALGPMKLEGSLHETLWGGQELRTLAGKRLPEGRLIGESWETADDSRIVEGTMSGETLGAAVAAYGARMLGTRAVEVFGLRFPLLAKFLDAQQQLSVQAHPHDAYAAEHEGGKLGKTEAWYILRAAPGAQIIYGVNREVDRETVRGAIERSTLEELLLSVEVAAGDVIFVPAGTIHAIGAGVALYELQEYSDVTYRLYDYGRLQANGQPRELHIERGLDVIVCKPAPAVKVQPVVISAEPVARRRTLVACDYFVEDEVTVTGRHTDRATEASVQILTVLEGACMLSCARAQTVRLSLGETVALPAGLGSYALDGAARLVRSYVPETDDRALAQWRAAQPSGSSSR